ncbi:uncharacterized protein HD556DRAFT_1446633 [Suillus plorans]|uniref:DUF6532 domain-containing protein n=1 Tax=Suillus plorans TaxID=116603 RepID=A0A9P7AHY7_9AGAM|nr:uncharacterized protein HD556DRAFT_1446633 [Suillus plorans]KAG1789843.1 hypothetical protein HD556DRAFT_1446633 [Suillus plorans]
MSAGWGDQPQSQGNEQYATEYAPPDPNLINFPFHYPLQSDHRTSHGHLSQHESSWTSLQSQVRYHDDATVLLGGPSGQVASLHDQSSWTPQQYLEGGQVHTTHYPQPSGHLLQDLVHPRPRHFLDLGLPSYIDAWQTQHPSIPSANAPASHATLNPESSLDDSGSTSSVPNLTHSTSYDVFDDVVRHSNVLSPRRQGRPPGGSIRSTRSSRRSTKLTTKSSVASFIDLRVIPFGSQDFVELCKETIKITAFGKSLLLSPESTREMMESSWRTLTYREVDGAVRHWALDKLNNDEKFRTSKLEPVLVGILDRMKTVVKLFVYHEYGLAFDYTITLDDSHIVERATRVQRLVQNDTFLYGRLSVEGVDIEVAFANPAILSMTSYLLRDSDHKYHRYIKDLGIKPLLAMIATFCRWALQERSTGRCIASIFLPEANRVHHERYESLLDALSPSQLIALTSVLLANNSAL